MVASCNQNGSEGLKTNSIGESMTVRADGTHQAFNRNVFSRRSFITQASCFGAFYALAKTIPLPALAETVGQDSRVSSSPLVDKGFASVRKVGDGLYATIFRPLQGHHNVLQWRLPGRQRCSTADRGIQHCSWRFFPDGCATLRSSPVKGALDTHYHYDHSMGNAFYGASACHCGRMPQRHNELSKATFRCRVPTKLRCSGLREAHQRRRIRHGTPTRPRRSQGHYRTLSVGQLQHVGVTQSSDRPREAAHEHRSRRVDGYLGVASGTFRHGHDRARS